MAAELAVVIAGEPMRALAGRALYWPARRRLLIADLHLGKGDVFRRAGIGLPAGGTAHDLQRLDALLQSTQAQSLWILGDVLHGPTPQAAWRDTWKHWRTRHAQLDVAAIGGNHDRALPGADLGLALLDDLVEDGPFALSHAPAPQAQRHVLCGHLHPRIAVPGLPRRWPAFWLRGGMTVLPAFSHFTGGAIPPADADGHWIACIEGELLALPGLGQ